MGHNEDGGKWSSWSLLLENSNQNLFRCFDAGCKCPAYALIGGFDIAGHWNSLVLQTPHFPLLSQKHPKTHVDIGITLDNEKLRGLLDGDGRRGMRQKHK